jgi:hypothetical protein
MVTRPRRYALRAGLVQRGFKPMRQFDITDFAQAKSAIETVLKSVDDEVRLELIRDVTLDQIHVIIRRFPIQTQKEILVLLADRLMTEWRANK